MPQVGMCHCDYAEGILKKKVNNSIQLFRHVYKIELEFSMKATHSKTDRQKHNTRTNSTIMSNKLIGMEIVLSSIKLKRNGVQV